MRVTAIDHLLASHSKFGSSDHIIGRTTQFYKLALGHLCDVESRRAIDALWPCLAVQPPEAFSPLLRDPVIRHAIHEVLSSASQDAENCLSELLKELCESADSDWRSLPERALQPPIHRIPGSRVTMWSGAGTTPSAHRLVDLFNNECLPNRLVGTVSRGELIAAGDSLLTLTAEAVRLLYRAMPYTTTSVLRHVSVAAWARVETDGARMESGSTRTIPGMIFLSVDDLLDPWRVAEAILHEAAHEKLFDLYLTSSILRGDYDARTSPRITVPWNESHELQTNAWPVDQALAALHVYVHLACLGSASCHLGHRGEDLTIRSLHRGRFLADAIAAHSATTLGGDGAALVDWCATVLGDIDGAAVTAVGERVTDGNMQRFVEPGATPALVWSPTVRKVLVVGPTVASLLEGENVDAAPSTHKTANRLGLLQPQISGR